MSVLLHLTKSQFTSEKRMNTIAMLSVDQADSVIVYALSEDELLQVGGGGDKDIPVMPR